MDIQPNARTTVWQRAAPALLMMILAPTFTELLLGGTRLSTLIAFPPVLLMEILVWGGGAVLLRGLARKLKLGWSSLLLFALALAVAEEFVIQQTSLAPLVIQIKGVEWGRAGGINYVYALWALVYEAAWVVLFPTLVAELVFPDRRDGTWLSTPMAVVLAILFVLGAIMAWFAWTHIARVKTFHLPLYNPTRVELGAGIAVIVGLIAWGIQFPPAFGRAWRPASPAVVAGLGGLWGVLWFLLAVLAFGIAPQLSAPAVFAAGAAVLLIVVLVLPRWTSHAAWSQRHSYFLFAGALTGAMLISFLGFRDAAREDIVFKLVTNAIALLLMFFLGRRKTAVPHTQEETCPNS
ncbi:hypothetical protein HAV22_09390 [Massilia sp. TW-1]|uniref:Uncharacterized protein n=1 Tax=Telluria antibiotica TaxID=2717319 RepID=A0ABX0P9Z6_9BURK|nr:hypothetical protein [Telluria antibiotica]NIA53862.1 hypothetical protein [Telluria antibiotica]